jgi:hypothetical protein
MAEGILVCYRYLVQNDLVDELSSTDLHALLNSAYPAMVVWAILSGIALFCPFYYLIIRFRFVLFHCLVFRIDNIDAAWKPYGRETILMGSASVLTWFVVFACLVLQGLVLAAGGLSVLKLKSDDGKLDPGVFLFMYLFSLLVAFALLTGIAVMKIVLHDFVLPHMALEHLSFSGAWAACRKIIVAEKETFFWYLVLRISLALILWTLLTAIATVLGYLLIWFLNAESAGFDFLLDADRGVFPLLKLISDIVFVLVGLGMGYFLALFFGGPLAVWTRNFSLLFYAGRYRLLGDLFSAASVVPKAEVGTSKAG